MSEAGSASPCTGAVPGLGELFSDQVKKQLLQTFCRKLFHLFTYSSVHLSVLLQKNSSAKGLLNVAGSGLTALVSPGSCQILLLGFGLPVIIQWLVMTLFLYGHCFQGILYDWQNHIIKEDEKKPPTSNFELASSQNGLCDVGKYVCHSVDVLI